jgi:hypothetical protein
MIMFTKIERMDKKPPVLLITCDRLLLVNLVKLHAMAIVHTMYHIRDIVYRVLQTPSKSFRHYSLPRVM